MLTCSPNLMHNTASLEDQLEQEVVGVALVMLIIVTVFDVLLIKPLIN